MKEYRIFGGGRKGASLSDLDSFLDYLIGEGGDITERKAYRGVPWIFRGVTLRAQAVTRVPYKIYRGEVVVDDSADYQNAVGFLPDPGRLFGLIEASLTLVGRAYLFNLRNAVRTLSLRYFSPLTIKPKLDEKEGLVGWWRNLNGRRIPLELEDIVYFWQSDAFVELGPPTVSPVTAALAAADVLMNVDEFAAQFAARGMIKATILRVPMGTKKEERDRLKEWWQKIVSGVKNAFATHVLNAEAVEPTVIGEGFKELESTELTDEKRKDISTALGVPATILFSGDASGLGGGGVVKVDDLRFYRDTVAPECTFIAAGLNEQLFAPLGLRLKFNPQEMDVFQEDENQRSQAFLNYVTARMPRSITAQMLGLELPEGIEYADLDEAGPSNEGSDALMRDDMRRWQSVAIRRLRDGKRPEDYDFQSDHIALDDAAAIRTQLAGAKTAEEVKAAFAAGFRQTASYP